MNTSMNPVVASRDVLDTYFRYILTRFPLGKTDPALRSQFRSLLYSEEGQRNLVKGPYLELVPPYRTEISIRELAAIDKRWDVLAKHIHTTVDVKQATRKLYKHQIMACTRSFDFNLVIATGTGSGKTESFLYPIIRYCMENPGTGIRAVIIYPLNALVEDQMKRLDALLRGTSVTFGRYTGLTPNEKPDPASAGFSKNCLQTRAQMRSTPPNVLITNYAMLEYLLLRPGDAPLFDIKDKHSFKFLVLDEAHTYSGAQGTEVAFLLRRLRHRVGRSAPEIRYFATSATLGSGHDAIYKTAEFAKRLFGASFNEQSIVTGERSDITECLPASNSRRG